ncbi:MAG: hypothetical protein AAFR51_16665 [Pseudomonadota bacterium]
MKYSSKSLALILVLGATSGVASAQDMRAASEKVVACQSLEDAAERLACFETAATELSILLNAPAPQIAQAPVPAPPVTAAAPIEQAAAAAAPTAPAEAVVASATPVAVPPVAAPQVAAPQVAEQPVAVAATETETPDVPRSSLPAWIPRVTFGRDRDVEKEPDEYATTLTRIQRNKIGRHFFTTAEGHVWKQKQIEEIRAPKTLPAEVTLYQNITGGIRIKIEETDRSYGVQRVE